MADYPLPDLTQPPKKPKWERWKLLLLQSGIGLLAVLLALLLRFVGGTAYEELKTNFRQAIEDNRLLEQAETWLGNGTTTAPTTASTASTTTTTKSTTASTTAATLTITTAATPTTTGTAASVGTSRD